MRGSITLLLALSASYTTVTALPKPRIQPRDDAGKPKYSVVPLEPGDDDPASGGTGSGDGNGSSGSGSGDGDGDGVVTVIRTVVQTPKPVTQVITRTGNPSIVTAPGKTVTKAVPTTVAVINVSDDPVVTQTVTVPRSSASKPKSTEEPSATQEPETTEDEVKPTAQEPSDSLSSAPAPGVTPQPQPQPQPKPQPNPQPNPQPEPEPSTSIASAESIETSSTTSDIQTFPAVVTVTLRFPTSESSPTDTEPTILATQATQDAEAPENTSFPSRDSFVASMPPQETFVQDPAGNNGETWSTATLPYYAPVAPTTLLTSFTTSTTSSDVNHITPKPIPSSKLPDDGSWRTTYPPWSDDLAI